MKRDDKPGRKPFLLKRSIGARILLAVLLILFGIMLFMQVFTRMIVARYVQEYYTNTGELISLLTAEEIRFCLDDLESFEKTDDAKELLELCKEYNIYSLWVETSAPPFKTGLNQIYLPIAEVLKENAPKSGEDRVYELQQQEKDIFAGKTKDGVYRYKSAHGYDIISYLHGIYNYSNVCVAVIGVNFEEDSIHRDIETSTFRMNQIIIVTFIGLMFVLALFLHRSIFAPLRMISQKMREYASGGHLNMEKLDVKGEDELSRVAASYNKMTDEISAYVSRLGELEKARLTAEAEMSVAAQIQTGMLPADQYSCGQIQVRAVMKPAKEVAGDFYDYLLLPDGKMFFCIADVSGKGVSAALFMAEAVNAIRYNAALHSSPAQVMYAANNDLCARNPEMLFVTAYAAVYDPAAGTLTYCNAGHNPAYLIGTAGAQAIAGADCLLLGMFPDEEYSEVTVNITPGTTFFLYTDGLPETIDPGKAMFGQDRMEEELKKYSPENDGDTLISRMAEAAKAFAKGAEAHDDLTMMEAHFGRSLVLPARTDENMKLREFLFAEDLESGEKKKICLAAEEIFVNICRYAYNDKEPGTVHISTLITENDFMLSFSDTGVPYNPLETVQDPGTYDPDTQIGGLGKLMSFSIMDRQNYEYRDGCNILTLSRSLDKYRRES